MEMIFIAIAALNVINLSIGMSICRRIKERKRRVMTDSAKDIMAWNIWFKIPSTVSIEKVELDFLKQMWGEAQSDEDERSVATEVK
jgi:hypothetical protein